MYHVQQTQLIGNDGDDACRLERMCSSTLHMFHSANYDSNLLNLCWTMLQLELQLRLLKQCILTPVHSWVLQHIYIHAHIISTSYGASLCVNGTSFSRFLTQNECAHACVVFIVVGCNRYCCTNGVTYDTQQTSVIRKTKTDTWQAYRVPSIVSKAAPTLAPLCWPVLCAKKQSKRLRFTRRSTFAHRPIAAISLTQEIAVCTSSMHRRQTKALAAHLTIYGHTYCRYI